MEVVVIGNLPHLMVKDPFGELASKPLFSNQVESLLHVGDFF
jgi:hypothetical protein